MSLFTLDAGPLATAFAAACSRLDAIGFADLLWNARASSWPTDPDTQAAIAHRLGWVRALEVVEPQLPRVTAFAEDVRARGFTDVVLLGMGGSSLAPEVFRQVVGVAPGYPRFRILDSVDPDEVRSAFERAPTTLFVLASKSGSTIEPNAMAAEARRRVEAAGLTWGTRVVAITDQDTALHARSAQEAFGDVFVNPSDIGGRYSALSFFGLVPAALMGADLHALISAARSMETACRQSVAADNPGLALGALMAAGALNGRDKLTLMLPKTLASCGLWIEQLVAESTGKDGVGIVPIANEDPAVPLGTDRLAVAVSLGSEPAPDLLARAPEAGVPWMHLAMRDTMALGAEFLRWEVATAAAGLLLDVNPFDEPNVQQAKRATRTLLDMHQDQGRLSEPTVRATTDGVRISMSAAAETRVDSDPRGCLRRLARPGDYVAVLPYLPPSDLEFEGALVALRLAIGRATGCATMLGYGTRYLHSTGQLHKGGPNSGAFVVIVAEGAPDLPIPGEPFTFGILEAAQALGDFESLDRANRRALFVRLPRRDPALLARVAEFLLGPDQE